MSTWIADDFEEIARRARDLAGDTAADAMWHWCERCRVHLRADELTEIDSGGPIHGTCNYRVRPSCPTCDNRGFINSNHAAGPPAFVVCPACNNPWGHTTP